MLDAYAVRKAIPRIVLAVIGINLSIYLCLAAVDITNVVANSMARLIVGPFATNGMTVFTVETDPSNAIAAGVGIAVGAGPMYTGVTAAIGAITLGGLSAISGGLMALLWLLVPIALIALAILITVVIRQALLFFLIVVSPVAIACYILPGTEKYFQKWFDLFVKTLIVYPIITTMFALSDVFASIVMSTNTGGLTGVAKIITGIVVIFAPLFLIPFAFRFAGGAMAAIVKAATGVGDRAAKSGFVKERREHYGQRWKDNTTRAKAEAYRRNAVKANTRGGVLGATNRYRARRLNGYRQDILEREAELNERTAKAVAQVTNNGDDSLVRAYTVNKELADRERAAGRGEGTLWKSDGKGGILYQSAGGSWQDEMSVNEARRKYGRNNISQYQQSMAYEMKKAITQEQQDNLVKSFGETMDEWGATDSMANGAWIGAGFANQDKNRQWKHGRWGRDVTTGQYSMESNAHKLITEVDENIDSYTGSRSNADTWTTMAAEVQRANGEKRLAESTLRGYDAKVASGTALTANEQLHYKELQSTVKTSDDTLHRASRIVNSIRTTQEERDANGKPTGRTIEVIGAGAPARTQEEMRAFAKITDSAAGIYSEQASPIGPNNKRQPGQVEDSLNDRTNERRA